jgi:hypothetical protein
MDIRMKVEALMQFMYDEMVKLGMQYMAGVKVGEDIILGAHGTIESTQEILAAHFKALMESKMRTYGCDGQCEGCEHGGDVADCRPVVH